MGAEIARRKRTRYPKASEDQGLSCNVDLLLDTSVLIDTLRGRNGRKELLARLVEEGHRLTTTALNVAEIYAGIRSGEEARTSLLLDSLECHDLDAKTGKQAGRLKNVWAKKGKTISLPDAIIAAIAVERPCILLTDNRKDFPMPELNLYQLP
jgi:predicted nucleic acid-binding protein